MGTGIESVFGRLTCGAEVPMSSPLTLPCPTCGTLMYRFVLKAQLASVGQQFNVQITYREESIRDTAMPSLNCHFNTED